MPRHRDRPLPPLDELQRGLAEAGVADAPTAGDPDALQAILFLAGALAERMKRVSFPDFRWDDPRFVAEDDKVRVELAFARTDAATREAWIALLREQSARLAPPGEGRSSLLALDARPSGLREFQAGHLLYGEPTLSSWPHKPSESADWRIEHAREAGWAATLKEHNLLPGRGIVVLDEHQGVLLTEPESEAVPGIQLLLPSGDAPLWWNPFARTGDAEMQHWLKWGGGMPASAWREVLHYDGEE